MWEILLYGLFGLVLIGVPLFIVGTSRRIPKYPPRKRKKR